MLTYLLYMASPVWVCGLLKIFVVKSVNHDKDAKRAYLIMFGIVMALTIGLRNQHVGSTDTSVYFSNWEIMRDVTFSRLGDIIEEIDLEPGYLFSVWLLTRVFSEPQVLLLVSGTFFAITVCRFVWHNCDNVVLALIVFNCLGIFNFMVQGLRQALAMSICLWALELCKKNKLIKCVLTILLACTFHASAAVFFVIFFIRRLKLNWKSVLFFSAGVFTVFYCLPSIFSLANQLLNDNYETGRGAQSGGVVAVLIYAVIIAFAILFCDKKKEHFNLFVYMAFVGAISMIMRNSVSTIVERISYFFAFAQMVLLSNSIENIPGEKNKINIGIASAILCLGVAVYKASYSVVVPYYFFWQSSGI